MTQHQEDNKPITKWAKDLNRHYFKEDIQRAQRNMKGCSVLLATREIQIKITVRYHVTPAKMATMNTSMNNKCWGGCGEKVTLVNCWWECRLVQPLRKSVWSFLTKLKMELPFDPAIPFWEYIQRILKCQFKVIYSSLCSCSVIYNS